MTDDELLRYSRHILLDEIGIEGQTQILGSHALIVGAGGLGQQMDASMKMFNGSEVCSMLIVFMLLVWLADKISAWLRQGLA